MSFRFLLLLLFVIAFMACCCSAESATDDGQCDEVTCSEEHYRQRFTSFAKKYGKVYVNDEFLPRYNIFKANYNKIRAHNKQKLSFTMAVNQFADMTSKEFHSKMTGFKPGKIVRGHSKIANVTAPAEHKFVKMAPDAIDWRARGALTEVKNQQQCGSSWAFAAVGALEGLYAAQAGAPYGTYSPPPSLSVQQLMDCSTAQGNQGCNSGLPDDAFQYIILNGGLTTDATYPYVAEGPNSCNTAKAAAVYNSGFTVRGFVDVTVGSEEALLEAVALQPVSVAIESDQSVFQFYSSGVMDARTCGTTLDHAVLVVGYGTDALTGKKYWLVKNSWSSDWGEGGYIRLVRGINQCGITNSASYLTV